jgi:plastocyanin
VATRTGITIGAALLGLASIAGCGDDGEVAAPEGALEVVALDSLAFDQERYQAEAGQVTFFYRNGGRLPHTLLVRGVEGFRLAVGDTAQGSVELDTGAYEIYCDVPGHEQGGMVADLEVG